MCNRICKNGWTEAGIEIQDNLLSIMLLGSSSTEYENFIIAMKLRDVFPSLESLKRKLIEEKARQSDWFAKCNTDNNVLLSKNRLVISCFCILVLIHS